jgi:hypothetical protein
MKKSIDGLTRDGRKLKREVMTTATNTISLTFLCGISRRKEQLAVVQEAQKMLAGSNGNLMEIADTLSGCGKNTGTLDVLVTVWPKQAVNHELLRQIRPMWCSALPPG